MNLRSNGVTKSQIKTNPRTFFECPKAVASSAGTKANRLTYVLKLIAEMVHSARCACATEGARTALFSFAENALGYVKEEKNARIAN